MKFNSVFKLITVTATLSFSTPLFANLVGLTGEGLGFSTVQPSVALTPIIRVAGDIEHLGEVKWFAGVYAPAGFAIADGQEQSIASNAELFSKLGTTYGGDGQTTFALPNLQGRSIVGVSDSIELGQQLGSETVSLDQSNLPSHNHTTASGPTTETGENAAYNNMQPGLGLNVSIHTQGRYPHPTSPFTTNTVDEPVIGFVSMQASDNNNRGGEMPADGTTLPIDQNTALYSITLDSFGGDGRTNFELPDIRDSIVVGSGTGTDLTNRELGQTSGNNQEILSENEMPSHTHENPPNGETGATGSGVFENNLQQEVTLNYLIAVEGNYPATPGSSYSSFLGEISLFAGNYAPHGFMQAHGQLLNISGNHALFSLLGTNFGGDGRYTFALPDLRGRTAIGAGSGTGLTSYSVGQKTGTELIQLNVNNLPAHSHQVQVVTANPVSAPNALWLMLIATAGLVLLSRRAN
ncbi:phage tail protein [Paraglaciecola aestuariivivens]